MGGGLCRLPFQPAGINQITVRAQIPGFGSQKDVPVLRVDHISIKGLLLGVRLTAVSVTPILVEK